ncbi:hypothetical protein BDF21DRAFT_393140 [Thamnidium elegans]|nr:hypothetical protein BDF21DRAFT_393140 [Thamnidium elegans]
MMSGSEDQENLTNSKRPILSKYTSIPPSTTMGFDKNLTVEKAKYESIPTASLSTPIVSPTLDEPTKSPPLTTSVTLPIVTMHALNNPTTLPSQSTPLLTKPKPKVEDRRAIKRKKLPPMNGTATPSEVFHRNLVDAVSNVEDSDENEQYVYPYSGNNTDTTYHVNSTDTIHRTTSSLYRPQSTRSFMNQEMPTKRGVSTGFLGELLRPILFKNKSDTRARPQSSDEQLNRPKLRNYVMDHPFNSQNKLNYGDWTDTGSPPSHHQTRRSRKMYSNHMLNDGGYTTDDEEAQLLTHTRRLNTSSHRKSYSTCSRLIRNMLIGLISIIILLFFCITYLAKPLKDLTVEMGRVLSSDKELIFDLHIHALNSNFWTVRVADADISVFAFSQVVPMMYQEHVRGVDPAEYLGGFYHFDEPLSFSSSAYSNEPVTAISLIRIKSPGADKSGNERWSRMIRYPYGLVVRGVLKYKPLPFLNAQSVAICDVVRVDPTTGKVSEDPDQGFCLTYGSNHTAVITAL